MPNDILKTIKINVDSSEYKALEKTYKEIEKINNRINAIQNENIEKLRRDRLNALKDKLKELNLTSKEYKETKAKLNVLKEEYKLRRKLDDLRKKQRQEEAAAMASGARQAIADNKAQRERQRQRQRWANPFLGGSVSDIIGNIGSRKSEVFDEKISEYEDTKKANELEIESLKLIAPRTKEGEIDQRSKEAKRIKKLEKDNKEIDKNIENTKDEQAKSAGKYKAMAQAAAKVAEQLNKVANVLLAPFKKLAGAVLDAVKQMIDFNSGVATFSTSTSLITNAQAREQQMKYGLTASQNYAFTQAKSMLNIQSDEDLMYMNVEQREKFLSYMNRYSQWFDNMEASGVFESIQEMQLEFKELANEIAMEFLQWVAENKEVIMNIIKGIFNFVKSIADFVMKIIQIISWGRYGDSNTAMNSDAGNYNTTNNNQKATVINVNANTTNNATGVLSSQEALDSFNKENFNKLAKQIATAIGG